MQSPPVKKRGGDWSATTPNCCCFGSDDDTPLVRGAQPWSPCEHANTRIEQLANGPHEICADCGRIVRQLSQSETREREERALLCFIARQLASIQAELHSPLTARRLHWRYCVGCGCRVTNRNCGGYTGRSALTGALYCENCCDEIEGAQ